MKKIRTVCLLLSLLLGVVLLPQIAAAEEAGYSITIQKYKLAEGVTLSEDVPQDGTKAEKVTDAEGNQLDPLSGITYEIVRVSPMEGTSEFRPVEGVDAFSATITTDDQGTARVSNLVAGTYRVSEKATETLRQVMEPVTFELPLPQRTGEALSEVYLYPKSSVQVLPGTSGAKDKDPANQTAAEATAANKRLPQTSGTLGTMQPLYLILVLIVVMGAIGGYFMRTKKHHF